MSEKKRKTCHICGAGFVPMSNNPKYCPDCRKNMQADGTVKEAFVKYQQARRPGPVTVSQIETPEAHLMDFTETPEQPTIREGYDALQKAIDMPDGLAFVEEAAEILRRYYKGELVDKNEFLARIRERLGEF